MHRQVWDGQARVEAFPAWRIACVSDLSIPLWFALYRDFLPRSGSEGDAARGARGARDGRGPRSGVALFGGAGPVGAAARRTGAVKDL